MLRLTCCIIVVAVTGCGVEPPKPLLYAKNGGSELEFRRDRYECLQQAQQPRMAGYANQYGAAHAGQIVANRALYMSCMGARGYTMSVHQGTWYTPPGSEAILVD